MRAIFLSRRPAAVLLLLLAAAAAFPGRAGAQRICPDPGSPCGSFKPYELSFSVPRTGRARAEEKSAPFYAVILRTAPRCSIPESERLSAQRLFPAHKAFVSRFECDGEDNVRYTTVDHGRYSVLALHAGETRRDAQRLLARVRRIARFRGAYARMMQAVLVFP